MSEQPEYIGEVARWVEKAENDLRNAGGRRVRDAVRRVVPDTVCGKREGP